MEKAAGRLWDRIKKGTQVDVASRHLLRINREIRTVSRECKCQGHWSDMS